MRKKKKRQRKQQRKVKASQNKKTDVTQIMMTKEDMTEEMREDKTRTEMNIVMISTTGKEVIKRSSVGCTMTLRVEEWDVAEELYPRTTEILMKHT